MDEDPDIDLALLAIRQVDFVFVNSETHEDIAECVQELTDAIFVFNQASVRHYGGQLGQEREPGIVSQIVGSAYQWFGDEPLYPYPFQKAAALLRGIIADHPFPDGNKRTAAITAFYFLTCAGYPPPKEYSVDAMEELCLRMAQGEMRDVPEIAEELELIWQGI